ncbi:hypothetical protein [Streptomyces sp. G45]|uniref:hypothetical protein n=1 Tax=Streptomyces sp. G45 TaxID=3406627 RepID=UPI003C235B69
MTVAHEEPHEEPYEEPHREPHEEPYEPRDGGEGADGTDGAADALMLALTGAPVPEAARDDPAFLAEHAAAVADVALLRERVRAVGDALARGGDPAPPPPAPRPARPWRSPAVRRRALLALAATLAAGLLGGTVWLGVRDGVGTGGDDSGAGNGKAMPEAGDRPDDRGGPRDRGQEDQSPEGYVACARLIVEGTVASVEPLPGGVDNRVTLDVSRAYKPAKAPEEVTFVLGAHAESAPEAGDRVLIGIPQGEAEPDLWSTGKRLARDRAWIEKALPRARGVEC